MTAQRAHLDFNRAAGGYNSLLFQTPCSWGTVYFPEVWMHLHAALVNNEYVNIPGVLVNGWKESWKKFLFSLMYHNDWYLLYPGYKQVWVVYATAVVSAVMATYQIISCVSTLIVTSCGLILVIGAGWVACKHAPLVA